MENFMVAQYMLEHRVYVRTKGICYNTGEEFVLQMNNHPVSNEKSKSLPQMWQEGMLENMHSGHTALHPSEIEEFGIDPEGLLSVENEDYQVNISVNLSEEQFKLLHNPLQVDDYCGIGSCLHCVERVHIFQQ